MRQARRHRHQGLDIWPGFVDAMSTLLMVIIFVLMTFILAQFYLGDAITSKDSDLTSLSQTLSELRHKMTHMTEELSAKELTIQEMTLSLQDTQNTVKMLTNDLQEREVRLISLQAEKDQEVASFMAQKKTIEAQNQEQEALLRAQKNLIADQTQQIDERQRQLEDAGLALQEKEAVFLQLSREKEQLIHDNQALNGRLLESAEKVAGLEQAHALLSQEFTTLQKENLQFKGNMMAFRSEFFGILQKAVGDRADMRVVGDRFVFQSEVLFGLGSSELGAQGKKQLDILAAALRDISEKIPTSIRWILRVDGHTDQLPINTDRFPSNWELSTARAMSVVHYLISRGIDPKHLVAAGFGEHQPLEDGKDAKAQARNRRIEFKLDQR